MNPERWPRAGVRRKGSAGLLVFLFDVKAAQNSWLVDMLSLALPGDLKLGNCISSQ